MGGPYARSTHRAPTKHSNKQFHANTKFVSKAKGNDYGICAVFYCTECMKVNNDINIQTTMAVTHHYYNENEVGDEEDSYVKY